MDLKKVEEALEKARLEALYGPPELRSGKFAINRQLEKLLVISASSITSKKHPPQKHHPKKHSGKKTS